MTNGSTPLGWRGRHWNALECPGRVFATGLTGGLRPINTASLPTVDSVVENIDSQLQQFGVVVFVTCRGMEAEANGGVTDQHCVAHTVNYRRST